MISSCWQNYSACDNKAVFDGLTPMAKFIPAIQDSQLKLTLVSIDPNLNCIIQYLSEKFKDNYEWYIHRILQYDIHKYINF